MNSDPSNVPDAWRRRWDVFQPHRDDCGSPEWQDAAEQLQADSILQEWWAEVQRRDAVLRNAFAQQVPVPEDLADRIIDALRREAGQEELDPALATRYAPPGNVRTGYRSRRWWVAASILVAISVCVVIVIGIFQSRRPVLTERDLVAFLLASADRWAAGGQVPPGGWRAFTPEQFPHLQWRMHRWSELATPWDDKSKVFEASTADGRRLFVFELTVPNSLELPPFPYRELPSTGPWKAGAWFTAGKLYVAVSNDPQVLGRLGQSYRPA